MKSLIFYDDIETATWYQVILTALLMYLVVVPLAFLFYLVTWPYHWLKGRLGKKK